MPPKKKVRTQQPSASRAISSVQPVLELSSLNLFQRRPVQLSVASEKQLLIDPVTVFNATTPVQFRIPGTDQFLSPCVYVVIEVKIKNADDSDLAAAAAVALTPNFGCSMFSDAEVCCQHQIRSLRSI